ncbi:hypothetical protein J4526_03860 [Desulfurococcaceae archaeon MEX13E-LK6-19]|nr:hypothetical protein J4526_03860 [Desulfurococcaceae archaeon MEX13E-LK6-19]
MVYRFRIFLVSLGLGLLVFLFAAFLYDAADLVVADYIIWCSTVLIALPTALELYVYKIEYSVSTTLSLDVLGLTYVVVSRSVSLAHSYITHHYTLTIGHGIVDTNTLAYVLATQIVGAALAIIAVTIHMKKKRPLSLHELLP